MTQSNKDNREYERDSKGFLRSKNKSCMYCINLKDNRNNDGFNCKLMEKFWKEDLTSTAEGCSEYKVE